MLRDGADDDYYLTAPEIDNPPGNNRYESSAQVLLTRINGLARARNPNFRRVRLSGKYTMPDGRNHHHADAHLESRVSLGAATIAIGQD